MITARRGNEVVEIQQIGTAGNNAMIYAIRKPKPEQPQNVAAAQQAQTDQQKQAADAAQQAAAKQKADQEAAAKAQAAQVSSSSRKPRPPLPRKMMQ